MPTGEMGRILLPLQSAEAAPALTGPGSLPNRLNADPKSVEAGLAKLVLTLVELIRQLLEREAIRRMERDTLTEEQMERLGHAFMLLQEKITELREHFGLAPEDLNIDLGPLGRVL